MSTVLGAWPRWIDPSLQENNNGKYKKNYKSCNFNYNTACLEVMESNPYVYVLYNAPWNLKNHSMQQYNHITALIRLSETFCNKNNSVPN